MSLLRLLTRPRFWQMALAPALLFFPLAYFTEDKPLILVLNIVQEGAAVTVVVTFASEVWKIVTEEVPMNRGSWLAYGIWLGWFSVAYRGLETIVWRFMGQPLWLANSDVTSAYLYMGTIAAMSHVVKPGELNDRLPRNEMIKVGLLLGAAVVVGLSIVSVPEMVKMIAPKAAIQSNRNTPEELDIPHDDQQRLSRRRWFTPSESDNR